jgi:flagellar hook-associated protein 2
VSSPITFSGFNNIDFSSIVNALMQQASQPLTALQTSQTAVKSQISAYATLSSRIGTMQDAASALDDASALNSFSGTSSDPTSVGVAVSSSVQAAHYDVVVNDIARAQVTVSATSAPDADTTVVASGGTLTIGGVDVAISGDVTMQQLATAINNTDGIGVSATVIRTAPGAYRLALTSRDTGADNAFTITNNLTGGSGVAFAGNAVEASDASGGETASEERREARSGAGDATEMTKDFKAANKMLFLTAEAQRTQRKTLMDLYSPRPLRLCGAQFCQDL